jgi:Lrp/AsnC family transcriptional regulator, regulator for asnA, asnC and gidA
MDRKTTNDKRKGLDPIDCKMIHLLQNDGRIPNTEMARALGVSEATVRSRLSRLIEEEYIQIVAVSNPIKLGFKYVGNINIDVEVKKIDEIVRQLSKLDCLWFIVQGTGASDIYAEFVARSIGELNNLLYKEIHAIDGVRRTNVTMILKFNKRDYNWGTGLD